MILALGRQGYMLGVDARTGAPLWEYTGFPRKGNSIPSPLPIGDGRIFLTSGYGAGCAMVSVEAAGGQYRVTELFKNKNMGTTCAQALLWDGYIYGNSADVGRRAALPDAGRPDRVGLEAGRRGRGSETAASSSPTG